ERREQRARLDLRSRLFHLALLAGAPAPPAPSGPDQRHLAAQRPCAGFAACPDGTLRSPLRLALAADSSADGLVRMMPMRPLTTSATPTSRNMSRRLLGLRRSTARRPSRTSCSSRISAPANAPTEKAIKSIQPSPPTPNAVI